MHYIYSVIATRAPIIYRRIYVRRRGENGSNKRSNTGTLSDEDDEERLEHFPHTTLQDWMVLESTPRHLRCCAWCRNQAFGTAARSCVSSKRMAEKHALLSTSVSGRCMGDHVEHIFPYMPLCVTDLRRYSLRTHASTLVWHLGAIYAI